MTAQETKRHASSMRAAVNADKKGWKEFTKHLDNLWRDLEKFAGRSVSEVTSFMRGLDRLKARGRSK